MEERKHKSKEELDKDDYSKRSKSYRDKERSGERHVERDREREKDRESRYSEERESKKDRRKDKEMDVDEERDRHREKEKERERAKRKEREHEREKRKREKEREREKKKLERDKKRFSDREDEYSSDSSEDERKDRDKKRRKKEEDAHSERSGDAKLSKHKESDDDVAVVVKKSHIERSRDAELSKHRESDDDDGNENVVVKKSRSGRSRDVKLSKHREIDDDDDEKVVVKKSHSERSRDVKLSKHRESDDDDEKVVVKKSHSERSRDVKLSKHGESDDDDDEKVVVKKRHSERSRDVKLSKHRESDDEKVVVKKSHIERSRDAKFSKHMESDDDEKVVVQKSHSGRSRDAKLSKHKETDTDENLVVKKSHSEPSRDAKLSKHKEVDDDENVVIKKNHSERSRDAKSSKHRETDEDDIVAVKKSRDEPKKIEKSTTKEEDLEEEQRQLDDEMEKRRRRVQEWQELKRKKEELEKAKQVVNPDSGKTWTLDGESDDDETVPAENAGNDMIVDDNINGDGADGMIVDSGNGTGGTVLQNGPSGNTAVEEDDIDPLDAFMNSMVLPEVEKLISTNVPSAAGNGTTDKKDLEKNGIKRNGEQSKKSTNKGIGRIIPGEDSDGDSEDPEDGNASEDEDDEEFMKRLKKTKVEKLTIVDHSKINYPPFRKNFYIEVKEISRMTADEVSAYRKELELKLHGKDVPKPIKLWHQTGLTSKILETIKKLNYEKPMPIQAQALPIIMSGRDCIGVAKTGSGKTLAFVLPMLRHIKDQPPVEAGDGPIGLIMAPTRELVQQIHSDIKKFAKVVGVRCVPVYGGSGVAQQISDLKRGTEVVVCTPGRMIDILCTSGGKITNLRRVTYLVMDEADRMFDMGFEPQITRIVQNTRPDRQTVLFSATFPRQVEVLARKVLNKPVEIQIGGRSVVNKDITQLVEVRPESDRFLRLLELLGEWYEKGKILVFVHSQDKCDAVFKELLKHGYPCLSLHGAKDQTDRESTISDFKSNVCNLLIATSVAARGLDVKELELVVNFDVPNHYEDYVHRVGRTGRAGRKGCAITFISEEDARYAPDLVKALKLSEQVVPADLKAIADGFMAKVHQGLEQAHGTGYGGSGFKFNEEEDEVRKAAMKAQAKEYGFEEDKSDSDDDDDGIRKAGGDLSQQAALAQIAAIAAANKANIAATTSVPIHVSGAMGSLPLTSPVLQTVASDGSAAARAAALAAAMNLQHNLAKIQADAMAEHYEAELEINDFPQNARWKVTHKETLGPIQDFTGAAITTRGQFYPTGKIVGPGDRKLYLFIEGPTEISVKRAKSELKRVLEDITHQTTSLPGGAHPGKYSVV